MLFLLAALSALLCPATAHLYQQWLDLQLTVLVKFACKLKASNAEQAQAVPSNHAGASVGHSFIYWSLGFLLHVFIYVGVRVPWHSWRSEDNSETQFSPPTMSVPENELRSSGLRGSDFNHWTISLALRFLFSVSNIVQSVTSGCIFRIGSEDFGGRR